MHKALLGSLIVTVIGLSTAQAGATLHRCISKHNSDDTNFGKAPIRVPAGVVFDFGGLLAGFGLCESSVDRAVCEPYEAFRSAINPAEWDKPSRLTGRTTKNLILSAKLDLSQIFPVSALQVRGRVEGRNISLIDDKIRGQPSAS